MPLKDQTEEVQSIVAIQRRVSEQLQFNFAPQRKGRTGTEATNRLSSSATEWIDSASLPLRLEQGSFGKAQKYEKQGWDKEGKEVVLCVIPGGAL